MLRAMLLEFPEDPACSSLDRQYMLGDSLLVAPVFSEDGWVSYYLPTGSWTHLLTGEVRQGPGWVLEKHGFLNLPLFVRPNTVLPICETADRPDYDYACGVTLYIYTLAEGQHEPVFIPSPDGGEGAIFLVEKKMEKINITLSGPPVAWQVLLVGIQEIESVRGGTFDKTELGSLVRVERGSARVEISTAQSAKT
jgi:alpha-D-xyloside xylohydrolase